MIAYVRCAKSENHFILTRLCVIMATLLLRNAWRGISQSAAAVTLLPLIGRIDLPVYPSTLNICTILLYLSLRTLDCCFHAGP